MAVQVKKSAITAKKIAEFVGIIGGLVGLIGGSISISDWYANRTPRLSLVISSSIWGSFPEGGKHLCILARVLNKSKKDAYLLAEAMEIHVYAGNRWYAADPGWPETPGLLPTNFSKSEQVLLGLDTVPVIRRYETLLSQNINPATRLILFSCKPEQMLDNAQRVRIRLKDGSGVIHTMEAEIPRRRGAVSSSPTVGKG
jgi:hypothetical protein